MSERKSLFDLLPVRQIFVIGFLVSFFLFTSIGFFVLLIRSF